MLQITVPATMAGLSVGEVLRRCGVSVTAIRRAKHLPGGITADGQPVFTNLPVYAGQRLAVQSPPHTTAVVPQQLPLTIALETPEAVVLEKPAGMAVHPTLNYPDGTLANAWLGELQRRRAGDRARLTGEGQVSAGFYPVYRLDKDTTGLILCAQNGMVLPILAHSCQKVYAALLTGVLPAPQGVCTAPIDRVPDSVILRRVAESGKPAETRWYTLAAGSVGAAQYTLAAFRLRTGRTHQIRVHMSHLGCPLAGDDLYGGEKTAAFPRQALHCAGLSFCESNQTAHRLFSPFPAELLAAAGIPSEQANAALRDFCSRELP